MPAMLDDLVRLQPNVIAAFGTAARIAAAARRAGTAGTAPIVVAMGSDPLSGYVTSLNRPDNNITGATSLALTLAEKRVELLHKLTPRAAKLALLGNPAAPAGQVEAERRSIETATRAVGWQLQVAHAKSAAEFDPSSRGSSLPTCRSFSRPHFQLVFNLKAAKALNLEVPPMLLALADEMIE